MIKPCVCCLIRREYIGIRTVLIEDSTQVHLDTLSDRSVWVIQHHGVII